MVKNLLYTCIILLLSFHLSAQLNGTYVINPNGSANYTSLSEAAADLNAQGMAGNVTLKLATALYTEQVLFHIPGQTASQMLTIESQSGNEADVVFRFEEAVEDTNYQLAFEDIKALTIRNISINTSMLDYGTGIRFIGGCSNVSIDNLHHDGNRNHEGVVGYYFVNFGDPVGLAQNVTIENSYFHEASPSISFGNDFFIEPDAGLSNNLNFHNNMFFDANGVSARFVSNLSIKDNVIYGDQYLVKAVELHSCNGSVNISNNKIWQSSFDVMSITSCSGTSATPLIVANNFISGEGVLVLLNQNTNLKFVFNSVYSDDDDPYQHLISTYGNTETFVENNIFYENNPEGNITSTVNTDDAIFDHNCMYSNGTYAYGFENSTLVYYNYAEYKTLSGNEANGISVQPIFTLPGEDLHTANQALNSGIAITEVPLDIDGEMRSTVNPSIGADEIDGEVFTDDLTIDTVTTSGNLNAGEQLTVIWTGANTGSSTFQPPWTDRIYLSADQLLDASDTEIGTYEVNTSLPAGATYQHQKILPLALNMIGTKYVIVKINANANIVEDTDNNTAVSAPFYITPPPLPNLVVSDLTLPENVFSGTQLQIQYTITNVGEAPASGNWTDIVWQENFMIGFTDNRNHHHQTTNPFATASNPVGLMPGESFIGTVIVTTPYIYSGYTYISIETDGYDNIVEEIDANDNFEDAPIDSVFINQSPLADLVIENIQVPAESFAGEEILISYTVKNTGTETTSPVALPFDFYFGYTWAPLLGDWVDYTYLSDTTFSFSPNQYEDVEPRYGNLNIDSTYVVNQTIQLPECEYGPYFITVYADRWNHVAELDEDNNFAVSDTINIIPKPGPDLVASSQDPVNGLSSNSSYTLSYHVENQGADTAFASWHDRVFISDSATFQFDIDEMVADSIRTTNLLTDAGVDYEIVLNIPPEVYGHEYIYLWIDAANEQCEQPFDNNNILQIPVEIEQSPSADLEVSYFPPSGSYVAGDPLSISGLITNVGATVPNTLEWTDHIFLRDEETSQDSVYREQYVHTELFMPNADYTLPNPFVIPLDIEPGFYSIGMIADAGNDVWENESEANNSVLSEPFQITIDSSRTPDLRPVSVEAQDWATGLEYSIAVSVWNTGVPTGINTWMDALFLTDTLGEVLVSATAIHSGTIESNSGYTATFEMEIPVGTPSDVILIAQIDTTNVIFEYQKVNNTRKFPIQINSGPTPDLAPTLLDLPSEIAAGQELTFSVMRNNFAEIGVENANWVDRVLLSQDNLPSVDDILLKSYPFISDQLAAESTSAFTDSIHIPLTLVGNYYIIYYMDADDQIAEGALEGNNYTVSSNPLAIGTPAPVDFSSTFLDVSITAGNPENLQYQITNISDNGFTGKLYNTWYLSEDTVYAPTDYVLGFDQVADFNAFGSQIHLEPGESTDRYAGFIYQPVTEGDYYIIQKIDAFLNVYETNEQNNTIVFGPFHINNIPEIFPDITYEKQFGRNLPQDNYIQLGPVYIPPAYDSGYDPSPDRHDYKINIPDAYGMITHMWENEAENEAYGINNESQPIYEMYIGENYVPDPLNFDFRFDNPLQSDQTVLVPVAEERTDYIKTRAPYIPPHFDPEFAPVSNYFLRAEFKQFSVFSLKPEKIGNTHNVTLRISGFDLADSAGLDVALFQGTDTVFAFETYPQNPSELIAYIDMRGHDAGTYQLMVRKRTSGNYTIWDEPVEVIEDKGARLFTKVNAPASSRVGLDIPVSVTYGNDGYSNIYDLLVIVAIFMDDSTSTGLHVDYLGSTYPGYSGNGYISTAANPAELIEIGVLDNAVYYGAYVPIVHARSEESFQFAVRGERGVISIQSTLGLVRRSPYTFSGRVTDAGRSNYAVLLGRAMASSQDALSELAESGDCDQTLNADAMTQRLAEQTYEVAKKAHGSTSWAQDQYDSFTNLLGVNTSINQRKEAFEGLVDAKGDLSLTANEDTPFFSELTDIFDCMEPGETTYEDTDDACIQNVTWTEGNRTFKVKMDMHGSLLSCPVPDEPEDQHIPKALKKIANFLSIDPNEIIGPSGIGPARLVSGKDDFTFTIYFENVAEATAPAVRVRIENPLDTNLRIQSLRIVSFGFADTSFQFNGSPYVQQTVNLGSAYQNHQLRIIGGTNPQSRKAFFEFTTIDPATQGVVTGANDGFLLPNDSLGRGEGFITYRIDGNENLAPGTVIKNKAAIIFDENEIIETNTWKNTISGGELASSVSPLPEYSAKNFNLAWINETPEFAPPVKSFDIYVRDTDGKATWKKWLGGTKFMQKDFTGIPGHTYEFYSRARSEDALEISDGTADARTTIINFKGTVDDGNPVLFPNPASSQTQLAYRSSGPGIPMQLRISDIQGKDIYTESFTTKGGGIQFLSIPIRKLSAGVYIVALYERDSPRGTDKLVVTGYPKP